MTTKWLLQHHIAKTRCLVQLNNGQQFPVALEVGEASNGPKDYPNGVWASTECSPELWEAVRSDAELSRELWDEFYTLFPDAAPYGT